MLVSLVLAVALGRGVLGEPGTPFERMGDASVEIALPRDLFVRPGVSWFEDLSGRGSSSAMTAALFGARARGVVEASVAAGPSYLSRPDQVLGGHFQFTLETSIGVCGRHNCIDVAWRHVSSGGLEQPNIGRDFIALQLRVLNL
jgi:hypothetical protein